MTGKPWYVPYRPWYLNQPDDPEVGYDLATFRMRRWGMPPYKPIVVMGWNQAPVRNLTLAFTNGRHELWVPWTYFVPWVKWKSRLLVQLVSWA